MCGAHVLCVVCPNSHQFWQLAASDALLRLLMEVQYYHLCMQLTFVLSLASSFPAGKFLFPERELCYDHYGLFICVLSPSFYSRKRSNLGFNG